MNHSMADKVREDLIIALICLEDLVATHRSQMGGNADERYLATIERQIKAISVHADLEQYKIRRSKFQVGE